MTEAEVRDLFVQTLNSDKPNAWAVDFRFVGDAIDSLDQAAVAAGHASVDEQIAVLESLSQIGRFAELNNTLGHDTGEQLVRKLGKMLQRVVPQTNAVARHANNMFAVALDISDPAEIELAVARLQALFEKPINLAGLAIDVTVTIGEARFPDQGVTARTLMQHADTEISRSQAVYRSQIGSVESDQVAAYMNGAAVATWSYDCGGAADVRFRVNVDTGHASRGYPAVTGFSAHLEAGITPVVVQRVNRLLVGTGVEVKWYFRTNDVRVHVGRGWHALPLDLLVTRDPAAPMEWTVVAQDPTGKVVASTGPRAAKVAKAVKVAPVKVAPAPAPAPVRAPTPVPMTLPVREVVAEPAPAAVTVPALPEPAPAPVKVAPAPRTAPTGLFRFPALTEAGEVVIKPDTAQHLDLLWGMHTAGKRQVIALVGPTGTGKTSLAYRLAARHGVGVMVFDAAGAREFSDWVGTTHLRDGRTEFLPSGFLTAIDADGPFGGQPRIVVIDEVNRAESSGALNALIPVLHGFGSLYVPEMGRSVNVDPTVMVVLTANRGTAYAGTVGMDLALQDRVTAWLRLDYLEEKDERALLMSRTGIDEAQATRLTAAAVRIRDAAGRGLGEQRRPGLARPLVLRLRGVVLRVPVRMRLHVVGRAR